MDLLHRPKSGGKLLRTLSSPFLRYPRTLWNCVRHPARMMHLAEREPSLEGRTLPRGLVDPPTFLVLTLLVAHLADLGLDPTARDLGGAPTQIFDPFLLRVMLFGLLPLMLAVQRVRRIGRLLTRGTLRQAMNGQCYAAAPLALAFDLSMTGLGQDTSAACAVSGILLGAAVVWHLAVEAHWFASGMDPVGGTASVRVLSTLLAGTMLVAAIVMAMATVVASS